MENKGTLYLTDQSGNFTFWVLPEPPVRSSFPMKRCLLPTQQCFLWGKQLQTKPLTFYILLSRNTGISIKTATAVSDSEITEEIQSDLLQKHPATIVKSIRIRRIRPIRLFFWNALSESGWCGLCTGEKWRIIKSAKIAGTMVNTKFWKWETMTVKNKTARKVILELRKHLPYVLAWYPPQNKRSPTKTSRKMIPSRSSLKRIENSRMERAEVSVEINHWIPYA